MTFWGMKNSCKIWTLNGPKLECINNDNGKVDIGKVYPGDIITTLKILYGDIKNYIKAIEQNDQELKDNSQFLNVLLKQIRCCCNTSREWNKNNGYISAGGIQFNIKKKKDEFGNIKKTAVLKQKGQENLSMDWSNGGEWFELLTAQALINAGCQHVHARVRLPFSDKYISKQKKKHRSMLKSKMPLNSL